MAASMLSVALTAIVALAAAPLGISALEPIDKSVLNFALNLEYLEANFYSCAVYGKPIASSLWGTGGVAPLGCKKAKLGAKAKQVAIEIAADELAHVVLLRAVLGNESVPQPLIDVGPAFAAAANAAASIAFNKSTTLKPAFDPYASDLLFYHGAFIFEDVGATAYAGAAALIKDPDYLTAAAQILSVESYHAGAVRLLLAQAQDKFLPFNTTPKLRVRDAVKAISGLRDAADGPGDMDQNVVKYVSGMGYVYNVVPTDSNGLIYTRTTNQVLRIVYLGGADQGGFFPSGLNGDIKVAA